MIAGAAVAMAAVGVGCAAAAWLARRTAPTGDPLAAAARHVAAVCYPAHPAVGDAAEQMIRAIGRGLTAVPAGGHVPAALSAYLPQLGGPDSRGDGDALAAAFWRSLDGLRPADHGGAIATAHAVVTCGLCVAAITAPEEAAAVRAACRAFARALTAARLSGGQFDVPPDDFRPAEGSDEWEVVSSTAAAAYRAPWVIGAAGQRAVQAKGVFGPPVAVEPPSRAARARAALERHADVLFWVGLALAGGAVLVALAR